jgi:hypothetical protein
VTEELMNAAIETMDETRLAEEIVRVLPEGAIRVCSGDRETIRFCVRSGESKLRSVVLRRASLRRLLHDPDLAVKVEYLQRDLLRSADARNEYAYPRPRVAPKSGDDLTAALSRFAAAS